MFKRVLAVAVSISLHVVASGFEVAVFPLEPRGGEGVLVTITGEPRDGYEVNFNGKTYVPYGVAGGRSELFLPLKITDSGRKKITVRRPDAAGERKEIMFEVKERVRRTVLLKGSDEKMRDRQPMVEAQNALVLATLRHRSDGRAWDGAFQMPVESPVSTYFAVHRKGKAYSYYHKGLDFAAPTGTGVKAMNNGRVIFSEKGLNVYGDTVIVDHGHGVVSCYFHLSRLFKAAGDPVRKGEVVAEVGASGWATGPHLHLGLYLQGEAVDPRWWVSFTEKLSNAAATSSPDTSL